MSAGHVHTLVSTQHTVVLHLCNDSRTIDADDQHVQGAIIKQHMVALMNVGGKVLVGEIHNVVGRVDVGTSKQLDDIARLVGYGLGTPRRSDLRTFGVYQYADMATYLAHVPYYIFKTLL